ncbi:G protein-coupled receptor associated sorting protein 3-like [Loxodonta africana]|uniref:G protein-coupled receptor associated sorting protein 3-like n=1 Tax=Loxodonta africana TaxID=9785 RepID=UPI000223675E|nr:protein BHLHb9-like [Loxodonta africana]XP_023396916.1 protein BHLHb9-like [Loxodonta africana]
MPENKSGTHAKTRKGTGIKAEGEREATGIVKAKAGFETDAVAERKGVSEAKVVTEMKARALSEPTALVKGVAKAMPRSWARSGEEMNTDFGPRAEDEAAVVSGFSCVAEESAASGATHKDETDTDAWFWAGEEASIGSWFWNGEEAGGDQTNAKDEGETDIGASINTEELGIEAATGASWKPRPEEEGEEDEDEEWEDYEQEENEEEGEVVIGKWFWGGDKISFDPNPRPVYRIVKPRVTCEIDERNRPKDWSEVTIWPNAPAEIPALLASRYQVPSRTRPLSYTAQSSGEKNTGSLPAAEAGLHEGTSVCLQSIDAYPFDSETCTQAIEKIRGQIRIRELNGIRPFPCPCKMECRLNSEDFEKLVSLLKSNADPVIHKIAQIAMGIIKVHPLAQELINEMGVLTVIESLLDFQFPDMTRKAEITLNPISVEERQRRNIIHVVHMCKETVSFPLNSPGQRSGLKELGQLSADRDHHFIVAAYLPELSRMLSLGNHKTRNLVLKVLLNMSENPIAARDMMNIEVLSALKLIFHQKEAKANLVTAVAIFVNIKEHIRRGSIVVVNPVSYNELKAVFREVKTIIEKL